MDNRIDRLQVPILLRYRDNSKDWFSVSIQGSSQDEIQRDILQLLRPTEGEETIFLLHVEVGVNESLFGV